MNCLKKKLKGTMKKERNIEDEGFKGTMKGKINKGDGSNGSKRVMHGNA